MNATEQPQKTLPGSAYTDPEILHREQLAVFARTWQYVCHVEKLRKPGAYFVTEIAGESIIVIRDEDGDLRAFFNVCAHRAARLLSGEGCKKRITCPYHAWTYDSAGNLLAAPNAKNVAGFDTTKYQLKSCGIENLHGLIFVNLNKDAPSLRSFAVGLEQELADHAPSLPYLTFVHRTEAHLKANWKVAIENYSECYHCQLIHKDFVNGVVDPESYRVIIHDHWQTHKSRSRTGRAKAYAFDEGETKHASEFGAWWLWPNFAFQSYPGGAVHTWKWIPIDAGNTYVVVDWFFPSVDLRAWERELIRHHAATTFAEDIPLVESVQQGLASSAYEPGPLMIDAARSQLSEHGVLAIQDLWRGAMVRSMPDPMTPADRLNAISEQGLCIGCGLCQSVAGPDRIQVVKNQEGNLRPIVTGELDHRIVDQVYDVCPGTHVQGMPAELIGRETKVDNVWGPWRRIVRAWAADPKIRFEGATGGVLTALAGYLLSSGRVSFVLHTQTSTTEPAFGERRLSFTQADVLNAAGSRYGPTATLIDIGDVLDRREPFAFIGKPCDIGALRNYARHDARVNEFVTYWLTLVCGGFMPTPSRDDTLRRFGVEPEDVTGLRYRGRGCPGPTTIETKAGPREMHYLDFWGEDSSQWSLPFRCKICPDGIGESADLAAADSWPGGSPNRIDSETDPGTNAVIVRTAAGLDLIEAAARDGALVIEYDQTPDDMSFYQTHQMRKKYAVWPRLQGLADEGHIMPRYQGLRLEELSAELPAETNDYQRQGTRRRVRDGKVSEATPRPAE